jgi:cellulose synthase (UDP-forming)
MEAALKSYGDQVDLAVETQARTVRDSGLASDLRELMTSESARGIEVMPYKFHVSEDFYTSMALHGDGERKWRSVYHPQVLSQMLSPQDLLGWTIQRFKYAGGTLDIFFNDNPLRKRGLGAWQKLMYLATMYAYFSPLWTVLFLIAPLAYLFTGVSPIAAYGREFYVHIVPFLIVNKLAFVIGTWGVPSWRGEQYYLSSFWINLRALADAVRGKTFKFVVTPKTRQMGNYLVLVWPHVALMALTVIGLALMGVRVFVLHTDERGAYVANLFWSVNNLLALGVIVMAAVRRREEAAA